MECKGSQRILAAIAHMVAGSSAVSVAGVTLCAVLQPSSLQVSQNTSFTELCADDGMHAISLSYTHERITSSCPFTETLNTNKLKYCYFFCIM